MSHDKIKDTVNKHGIITTLKLFGGNKDIIKQVHIMDYNNTETRAILKSWLEKHIPSTKHLTPISKSHEYFQSNLSVKTSNYVI